MDTFERDGISFRYPENWTAEVEESEDGGWAVTVASPETAFVLVSLRPDAGDPARLADETLAAMREVYEELDADNALETIAGQPAIGYDIDVLTVDVPVVCRVRALETPVGPLLVLAQSADLDLRIHEPVLRAIVASLRVDEE